MVYIFSHCSGCVDGSSPNIIFLGIEYVEHMVMTKLSDLIKQLREAEKFMPDDPQTLSGQAADHIEEQDKTIEKLQAAITHYQNSGPSSVRLFLENHTPPEDETL